MGLNLSHSFKCELRSSHAKMGFKKWVILAKLWITFISISDLINGIISFVSLLQNDNNNIGERITHMNNVILGFKFVHNFFSLCNILGILEITICPKKQYGIFRIFVVMLRPLQMFITVLVHFMILGQIIMNRFTVKDEIGIIGWMTWALGFYMNIDASNEVTDDKSYPKNINDIEFEFIFLVYCTMTVKIVFLVLSLHKLNNKYRITDNDNQLLDITDEKLGRSIVETDDSTPLLQDQTFENECTKLYAYSEEKGRYRQVVSSFSANK